MVSVVEAMTVYVDEDTLVAPVTALPQNQVLIHLTDLCYENFMHGMLCVYGYVRTRL